MQYALLERGGAIKMGLLDFFRKKRKLKKNDVSITDQILEKETSSIPDSEKQYYQEDEYYTSKVFEGSPFEKDIISLEERKKTSIPSRKGLFVSEILLLHYCSKGTYPNPQNGYPGFWWFAYGIRDVGAALRSLESRGFIELGPAGAALKSLTITQLKEILREHNLKLSGKKDELVLRVYDNVSETELLDAGIERKYMLTKSGEEELSENEYVAYMHSHSKYTDFTVWDLNWMLGYDDKSHYKEIIDSKHKEIENRLEQSNKKFMDDIKSYDPNGYRELRNQDEQIKAIQEADRKYAQDKDLMWIINFWERIWQNGGPIFEGSHWMFRLPDFYIKAKRYDDAIALCERIKVTRQSYYHQKADNYIKKIEEKKAKEESKK